MSEPGRPLAGRLVALGVTGSIAAYKTAELVRALIAAGAEVQVLMSRTATAFIGPLTLETLSRNEGKPEAALPKIVEGRLGGFFKDVVLLEQPYAKDDKQSIQQFIGKAGVVRFAQVEIG